MSLHITKEKTIADLQQEFNSAYPFLKIEFFMKAQSYGRLLSSNGRIQPDKKLGDVCTQPVAAQEITITGNTTVAGLEAALLEHLGLFAQVFRKSGSLWLETTITDGWTLKQQNDHGTELSTNYAAGA